MRVHVDARVLSGEGTGVSTYARTLIAAIARSGRGTGLVRATPSVNPVSRLVRALRPGGAQLAEDGADLVGRDIFKAAQWRFDRTGDVLRLRAPKPGGIVHWTYPVPIVIEGWANLYTVHDAIPLTHPAYTPIDAGRHACMLAAVSRSAHRIVTVSEAARQDILAYLRCDPGHVVNCSQAVAPPAALGPLPAGVAARDYLFFCGRIEPRKNLARLIRAYAASGVSVPLLLAGPVVEGSGPVIEAIARTPGVVHLGFVERETLLALIGHARALLFPSLAEGFGLPVAEAMALGTPALVSRIPALLEVAGDAALAVDAEDEAEMASAIARICEEEELRAELRARGLLRAQAFSLDAWSRRLDTLYASL